MDNGIKIAGSPREGIVDLSFFGGELMTDLNLLFAKKEERMAMEIACRTFKVKVREANDGIRVFQKWPFERTQDRTTGV